MVAAVKLACQDDAQARGRFLPAGLLNDAAGDAAAGVAGRVGLVVVLAGMDDQRRAVGVEHRVRLALVERDRRVKHLGGQFARLQQAVETVQVHPAILDYVVAIVQASRRHRDLALGSSPRGSLALLKVSRALALLAGRDFVTPDDVRAVVLPALGHRVVLTDEAWARGTAAELVVRTVVDSVAAPTWK